MYYQVEPIQIEWGGAAANKVDKLLICSVNAKLFVEIYIFIIQGYILRVLNNAEAIKWTES